MHARSGRAGSSTLRLRGALSWSAAVGVPSLVTAVHGSLYGRWIVDDAAITFAYALSLLAGIVTATIPAFVI